MLADSVSLLHGGHHDDGHDCILLKLTGATPRLRKHLCLWGCVLIHICNVLSWLLKCLLLHFTAVSALDTGILCFCSFAFRCAVVREGIREPGYCNYV